MLFSRFLFGPLMDEAQPDGGGGGASAQPSTPPQPAVFDPSAFESKILGEFDKRVNALDKRFKGLDTGFTNFSKGFDTKFEQLFERFRPAEPPAPAHEEPVTPPAPAAGAPATPPTPAPATSPKVTSPEVLRLQREVQEFKDSQAKRDAETQKKEADLEQKAMATALKGEVGLNQFALSTGPQDLFNLLLRNVVKGEDGQYYGPDGVTLQEYVRAEYAARPTWHPAKQANGSGAPAPTHVNGRVAFDIDRIKAGYSKDDRSAAAQAISQALQNR